MRSVEGGLRSLIVGVQVTSGQTSQLFHSSWSNNAALLVLMRNDHELRVL